ncbi:hypothetical protein N7452_007418 [Penicillium brevicompactum]|uniref:F-box domain-containing protein n=1 Tax=Penicillium brevicompactum TaxID=5074 RepID=A0A9W9QF65_PENBR|nr:hypothetical protein N7452_007418 [Penicillium brevicompactum]
MATTAGYITMPALRSLRSSQDYAGHVSDSRHRKPTASISTSRTDTGYLPVKRQTRASISRRASPSAANLAPPEILLDIFSLLSPHDFDSARHTCSRWMRVSLNEQLLERMMKRAGWWKAWLQDRRRPCVSDRLDECDVWRMSRRFATECLLSGRRMNSKKSGFVKTAVIDFSALSGAERRSHLTRHQAVGQLGDSKELGASTSTFSTSSCSNYLLVTMGCMIYVYRLRGRKIRSKSSLNDVDLDLISRVQCPFDVVSAVVDTTTSQITIAALLHNRVGIISKVPVSSKPSESQPTDPSSTHLFYNICTEENPPRTVAICPGQDLVAFGCASGIEIHSVSKSKRNDPRKHFTIPQPSEILHFLPSSPDSPTELRLISSLSGPGGLHECTCPPTSPKHQFHFLADVQSYSRRRIPHTPSRSFVRATHCHHFHAVPLNDGFHMTFIDPRSNLLCIGSDAPIGGPTSLTRAIVCVPPFSNNVRSSEDQINPLPTVFAAASDLTWGIRLVAVYGDRLVLYSVPLDVFDLVRRERERQVNGVMGDSDLARDWYADADRCEADLESLDVFRSVAMMWPFKVYGKEIGTVDDAVELSVQCSEGGVRVWAFGRSGKAEVFDIETGDGRVRSFGSGADGVLARRNSSLKELRRKRKFEDGVCFAGRYGAGRLDVKPCRAGVHGQDLAARRSSFAACIIDFKIPE